VIEERTILKERKAVVVPDVGKLRARGKSLVTAMIAGNITVNLAGKMPKERVKNYAQDTRKEKKWGYAPDVERKSQKIIQNQCALLV
jgi:hypothetical protein